MRYFILRKVLPAIRCWVYNKGFRPKAGSILFSPSLDLIFQFKDADASKAFTEGWNKGRFVDTKTTRLGRR